jgi:hypothetical protein
VEVVPTAIIPKVGKTITPKTDEEIPSEF